MTVARSPSIWSGMCPSGRSSPQPNRWSVAWLASVTVRIWTVSWSSPAAVSLTGTVAVRPTVSAPTPTSVSGTAAAIVTVSAPAPVSARARSAAMVSESAPAPASVRLIWTTPDRSPRSWNGIACGSMNGAVKTGKFDGHVWYGSVPVLTLIESAPVPASVSGTSAATLMLSELAPASSSGTAAETVTASLPAPVSVSGTSAATVSASAPAPVSVRLIWVAGVVSPSSWNDAAFGSRNIHAACGPAWFGSLPMSTVMLSVAVPASVRLTDADPDVSPNSWNGTALGSRNGVRKAGNGCGGAWFSSTTMTDRESAAVPESVRVMKVIGSREPSS